MFKTTKAKLERRRLRKEKSELDLERSNFEERLLSYETLLEEVTKKYDPLRIKCMNLIRSTGLNHYPLKDTLEVTILDDNKIEFKICDIKEDYWDGDKCLIKGGILFNETIQLNALVLVDSNYVKENYIINSITKLRDLDGFILYYMEKIRNKLEELENKIKDIDTKINIYKEIYKRLQLHA